MALLEARAPVLRPRPLGESAVSRLVRDSLGDEASTDLCRACAEATGGNPFLLSELLGEFGVTRAPRTRSTHRRSTGWHRNGSPPPSCYASADSIRRHLR